MLRPRGVLRSIRFGAPLTRCLAYGVLGGALALAPLSLTAGPPLPPPEPTHASVAESSSFAARRELFLEGALSQAHRLEGAVATIGAQDESRAAIAAASLTRNGDDTRASVNRYVAEALKSCRKRPRSAGCARGSLLLARLLLEHRALLEPGLVDEALAMLTPLPPPPSKAALADPWDFRETENQRVIRIARAIAAATLRGPSRASSDRVWEQYAAAFLRARLDLGWYEQDSPGYLAISVDALLFLADHAASSELRHLATRQLDVLFASWAQNQVEGYPAGPKTRTYRMWATSNRSTPWSAWYWLITGRGDPAKLSFLNAVELPVAGYRVPEAIATAAADRRKLRPYEILARRRIDMVRRRHLDIGLYSWATPSYILSVAQAVSGSSPGISGGQEICVALYPDTGSFAPLYLWSRSPPTPSDRWKSYADQDLAVGDHNVALGRFGRRGQPGYAYLAPGWSRPQITGDLASSEIGPVRVTLVTIGGWRLAPAGKRFPPLYSAHALTGAWVLVPQRQPALIALEVAAAAESRSTHLGRAMTRRRLAAKGRQIVFTTSDGRILSFIPGRRALIRGTTARRIDPGDYPLLAGPLLSHRAGSKWSFHLAGYEPR